MTASRRALVGLLLAAGVATAAFAGGPIYTFDPATRTPYAWSMERWPDGHVPVYTDLGTLGVLDKARAYELVEYAAEQWSTVPTTSFRARVVGDLSALELDDINGANILSVLGTWNGGGIHVVYDDDGGILQDFFGIPADAVLGITNIDYVNIGTPEILESWIILSGPGIRDEDPDGAGFAGVVTHELGHALNLGHSQANGAVENWATLDSPHPSGCASPWTGTVDATQVETMYPISTPAPGGTGEYMASVDRIDDQAAISDLYPAPGYPGNRGTIRGTIYDSSGGDVTGVNVIARNVADPFNDFSSYLTGQLSKGQEGPDGSFVLNGLTPGASYVLYVDHLLIGAFAVPRFVALPGPEEFWNGALESADGSKDDRCAFTTVTATAGVPATADMLFNHLPGAPTLLQAPDTGVAHDITPDGSVVVGILGGQFGPVFRWDVKANTFEDLGGVVISGAAISDDGTKIVANARDARGTLIPAIYEDGIWTPLPPVAGAVPCDNFGLGPSYGTPWDISGDGSTVVGLSYGPAGCYGATVRAFKWTAAGGTVTLPKADTFDRPNRANAVNYDGTVIVGWDEAASGSRRAAQWRNGVLSLIRKGTNPVGEALDVTRDGQYVVGAINFATGSQAWRYRPSTGVEQIGFIPGQTGGVTNALSDDASVITGFSTSLNTGLLTPAIWTSGLGFSDLNQLLQSQGINTEGGLVVTATGVSSDGRTLTGHLLSRFGYVPWVLQIPTVLVCHLGKTLTVDFPEGMNTALVRGDTLGPCQCNTAAPTGSVTVRIDKPWSGTTRMSWTDVGGATGYDVVRGGLEELRSSGGNFGTAADACLQNDPVSTSVDETATPDPGDGFWYLVAATTCGGKGALDAGIHASPHACP